MTLEWSSWESIKLSASPPHSAVYRIRLVSEGDSVTIPRFLASDPEGILSIGVSGNMERRRKAFLRGLAHGRWHSEANLLRLLQIHTSLIHLFPDAEIHYSYSMAANREDAASAEEAILKGYVVEFGEVPPLNSAIPNRNHWASWEDAARRSRSTI